ncbi:hypothetical protein MNBD_GAMMA15-1821 [hydrothermal vent metagenome]|uniref:Transferrin-binding protein B C-lobe/N-lobe beta barrel domain-containing protein n=1 Tax=hydrothermal vent metagenome TaxID=652676 RepID=A0A3B0XWT4_9ZZZZ
MKPAKKLVAVSIALVLGMSSAADAATQREEDSAYQWGRWAVLSPAAGGSEPYAAGVSPVSLNSPRPETAPEYEPKILGEDTPAVVESFCTAGADCGYATYYKNPGEEGQVEGDRIEIEAAIEGYDQTDENPGGPVLARFNLEKSPGEYSCDGYCDDEQLLREPTANFDGGEGNFDGGEGGPQSASFEVFGTNDENFPDIASVEMDEGGDGEFYGRERSIVRDRTDNGDPRTQRNTQTSTLEEAHDNSEHVDSGSWYDDSETQTNVNTGQPAPTIFDFNNANGEYVFGRVATLDQLQAFAAGNVVAIYNGVVLDYQSAVSMQIHFGHNEVHASFASENGFDGFEITGALDGVNFSGEHGDDGHRFAGSIFSAGENVSGAVVNDTQLGVYTADHTHAR